MTGEILYQSIHFGIKPGIIQNKINRGYKAIFDSDKQKNRFKRLADHLETVRQDVEGDLITETDLRVNEDDEESGKNEQNFLEVLNVVKLSDRDQDFLSVLEALASGTLSPHNIAFQLFLDIGSFLSAETKLGIQNSR